MHGRTDLPAFIAALKTCQNYIPGDQGGIRRRRGIQQEFYTGKKTTRARLVPYLNPLTNNALSDANFFIFPTTMLTVGDSFITISRVTGENTLSASNNTKTITSISMGNPADVTTSAPHGWSTGDIVSLGALHEATDVVQSQIIVNGASSFSVPWPGSQLQELAGGAVVRLYQCATSYTAARLSELDYTQVGINLWFFHPDVIPSYGDFSGSTAPAAGTALTPAALIDGPYMDVNLTTTTLTPGAVTGATTLTASSITGINTNQGFLMTDVGRLVRLQDSAGNWVYATITSWTSATLVGITITGTLADTAPTLVWRLGLFSATTSYPYLGIVFQDRLYLWHENDEPISPDRTFTINASRVGLYQDFTPTSADGTVADADAVTIALSDAGATKSSWAFVSNEGLLTGTPVGGYCLSGTSLGEPITPTNIQVKKIFNLQCDHVRPVPTPEGIAFIHSARTKISEYTPSRGVVELTKHTRDIVVPAYFAELAWQRGPQNILWARTTDDKLYGASYVEVAGDEPLCGWFSFPLLSGHTIEGVAVHLYQDDSAVIHEDLRLIVKAGSWRRHMVSPYFANIEAIVDATTTYPVGRYFANNLYMDECFPDMQTSNVEFFNFQTLAGMSISYAFEGLPKPNLTVDADGGFTSPFSGEGSFHSFGLVLRSRFQLLRPEAGAVNGPGLGKTKRIDQFAVLVDATAAFNSGGNFTDMFENQLLPTPASPDPNLGVLQRFSGVYENAIQIDYDFDNEIAVEQSKPAPGLFMAIGGFISQSDR